MTVDAGGRWDALQRVVHREGGPALTNGGSKGRCPKASRFRTERSPERRSQSGTFSVTVSAVDYGFFVGQTTREIVITEQGRRRAARSF